MIVQAILIAAEIHQLLSRTLNQLILNSLPISILIDPSYFDMHSLIFIILIIVERSIKSNDTGSLTWNTFKYDVLDTHLANFLFQVLFLLVIVADHLLHEVLGSLLCHQSYGATSPASTSKSTSICSFFLGQFSYLIDFRTGTFIEISAWLLALVHQLSKQFQFLLVVKMTIAHFDELKNSVRLLEDVLSCLPNFIGFVGL